jgi:hypothetical protein
MASVRVSYISPENIDLEQSLSIVLLLLNGDLDLSLFMTKFLLLLFYFCFFSHVLSFLVNCGLFSFLHMHFFTFPCSDLFYFLFSSSIANDNVDSSYFYCFYSADCISGIIGEFSSWSESFSFYEWQTFFCGLMTYCSWMGSLLCGVLVFFFFPFLLFFRFFCCLSF